MKLSFACEIDHEPLHDVLRHKTRRSLLEGTCPVCPDQQLEGQAYGGLEWARCPCCGSQWRLEDDSFALRPGRIFEEWT